MVVCLCDDESYLELASFSFMFRIATKVILNLQVSVLCFASPTAAYDDAGHFAHLPSIFMYRGFHADVREGFQYDLRASFQDDFRAGFQDDCLAFVQDDFRARSDNDYTSIYIYINTK